MPKELQPPEITKPYWPLRFRPSTEPGIELAKLARRDRQHFDCVTW